MALFRGAPGLVGTLIRWQTRSRYSHAALVFNLSQKATKGTKGWQVIEAREFAGVRATEGIIQGEATVDLFQVDLSQVQVRSVYGWALRQIGKGYDYTMVARFVSRRQASRRSSGRWFCSELVFAAFQQAGIDLLSRTEPWEVSPGMLARSPLLEFHSTIFPEASQKETKGTKDPFQFEQLENRYAF